MFRHKEKSFLKDFCNFALIFILKILSYRRKYKVEFFYERSLPTVWLLFMENILEGISADEFPLDAPPHTNEVKKRIVFIVNHTAIWFFYEKVPHGNCQIFCLAPFHLIIIYVFSFFLTSNNLFLF